MYNFCSNKKGGIKTVIGTNDVNRKKVANSCPNQKSVAYVYGTKCTIFCSNPKGGIKTVTGIDVNRTKVTIFSPT